MFRYPTGTKLTGIVFLHRVGDAVGTSLKSSTGTMEKLCEDSTLKNLVIMIHQWGKAISLAEALLQSELSEPDGFVQAVMQRGAKIYRCTDASEPDLGALRIILGGSSVVPEVQQEPIRKGSESELTAERPLEPSKEKPDLGERHNSDIRELGGSTQEAVDKEVDELRRELEEQKTRAQQEADMFKKLVARMESKEESTRREPYQKLEEQKRRAQEEADMFKKLVARMESKEESTRREHYQKLEEQKRRAQEEADAFKKHTTEMVSRKLEKQKRKAQEEADGLRKCIAELQSELEKDRHAYGKTSATYNFRPAPANSRVFLAGSLTA